MYYLFFENYLIERKLAPYLMDGREDVGPKMFKQCADLDDHWWRLYER